ncbi:fluoride efflux transporter FluC [Halorhodospira halochloris]|uniref:fluoride efflux transporter FluC n=1 Tax=Halorhodospira halochloris TaxID=1052 RepID=UPI001EE85471|nr:CrcB family protein [Halorhodospira halochloris]
MKVSLWIGAGSAIGGTARFGIDQLFIGMGLDWFPWGTLAVNAVGSWLIGLVAAITMFAERSALPNHIQQFIIGGFCGGFTTFSILSLETLQLFESYPHLAAANILVTLLVCLLSVWLGYLQGKRLKDVLG